MYMKSMGCSEPRVVLHEARTAATASEVAADVGVDEGACGDLNHASSSRCS